MKRRTVLYTLLAALILSACSIEIGNENMGSFLIPATSTTTTQSTVGDTLPTFNVPVSWSSLKLTGKLVYVSAGQDGNVPYMRIQTLDLVTGAGTTIFQAPQGGWIYFSALSPDGKQLVMAYSPPPGTSSYAHQALYSMPVDGSGPSLLLFTPPTTGDEYIQPQWSPDGKYLYFVHVNFQLPRRSKEQHYPIYEIDRLTFPDGQPEKLLEQAFWPRLSWDGTHLVYVAFDSFSGKNELFVADADGKNPQQVRFSGQGIPDIIDAPLFSADNQSILFSAVTPTQAAGPSWWERLLGIDVALAHTVPSDWWSVPIAGGVPRQLTRLSTIGLFAAMPADKQHIFSYSGNGIFVMNPDGTGLTMIVSDLGGVPGTVSWMP